MLCKERGAKKIVNRDIEEALYLCGVEIHCQHAVCACCGDKVCNELCGDGVAAFCLAVLAGITEIRNNGGDSAC